MIRKPFLVLSLIASLLPVVGIAPLQAQPIVGQGAGIAAPQVGLWSPILARGLGEPGAQAHDTGFNGLTFHSVLTNLKRKDFRSQLGIKTLERLDTYMAQEIGSPERFESLPAEEKEAIYNLAASVVADFVRSETRAAVEAVEKGSVGDEQVYGVHSQLHDAAALGILAAKDQAKAEAAIRTLAPRVGDATRNRVDKTARRLEGLRGDGTLPAANG